MNFNRSFIVGRLSMNPKLKAYTNGKGEAGHRCFFRVAVTREEDLGKPRDEQRTDFIPIVTWGEAAKHHAEYLQVGTEVTIEGRIRVDTIKEEGKEPRENITIVARNIQYGAKSKKNQASPTSSANPELVAAVKAVLAQQGAEETATVAKPGNPFAEPAAA